MTEFAELFDKHKEELETVFGNKGSFCVWMGNNEKNLPFGYKIEDIIALRSKSVKKTCPECGGVLVKKEDHFTCGKCKRIFRPCEIYSRVVGYIRPVEQWHDGKQTEFKDRHTFEAGPSQTQLGENK